MPSIRKKIILEYQKLTSDKRAFPDFIIIGAQKSGTTSMYSYLDQHPDIMGSLNKEIHFFDGGIRNCLSYLPGLDCGIN